MKGAERTNKKQNKLSMRHANELSGWAYDSGRSHDKQDTRVCFVVPTIIDGIAQGVVVLSHMLG